MALENIPIGWKSNPKDYMQSRTQVSVPQGSYKTEYWSSYEKV